MLLNISSSEVLSISASSVLSSSLGFAHLWVNIQADIHLRDTWLRYQLNRLQDIRYVRDIIGIPVSYSLVLCKHMANTL